MSKKDSCGHSSKSFSNRDEHCRSKDNNCVNILKDLCNELRESRQQWLNSEKLLKSKTNINCIQDAELIPFFDPSKNDFTVEQWIKKVDIIAEQLGCDDVSTLQLVMLRLKGTAKKWYNTRHCTATSWKQTKAEIIQMFSNPFPFGKLLKEAVLYSAHAGQNLGEYCFEKLMKWEKLNIEIPEENVIDLIIEGINNINICRTIRTANHTQLKSFYQYMRTLGPMPMRSVIPSKVKCFNCNKEGHFYKNCIKNRNFGTDMMTRTSGKENHMQRSTKISSEYNVIFISLYNVRKTCTVTIQI